MTCEKCKRPTPTKAQWDYDGPLHGDGNGCECAECAAMCWGDPIDCARAAHGEDAVSRYTQEHVNALIAAAVNAEREACAKIADDYRKSATTSGVPQIILLGGAAQIIRNLIRDRSKESL